MPNSVIDRVKRAWNAFKNVDDSFNRYIENDYANQPVGFGYSIGNSSRPDRFRFTHGNERSIINAVYNRIAMDVAALTFNHVKLDENDRFSEIVDDGLNKCMNLSANVDQTGREFIQDLVMSILDEGCAAAIPVDTDVDPNDTSSYEILSMRTARIVEWYPQSVRVDAYNELTGNHQKIVLPKKNVAIIENPMYAVMNESNSTLKRLIRKLNILDRIDDMSASNKFNMIIQLPYAVRGEKRKAEAEDRRKSIEAQLNRNEYGIAYIDSAEKITQLNRPLENNLLSQIEYLTSMLYGQIGITQAIMDGTADEKETLNYTNRAIEPLASAIVNEFKRKFLTKTAITQKHSIMFFRDPFKLVPIDNIAEIADKFTRNEIMTKNEFRQAIGMKPSDDPRADQLRNANLSESSAEVEERLGGTVASSNDATEIEKARGTPNSSAQKFVDSLNSKPI